MARLWQRENLSFRLINKNKHVPVNQRKQLIRDTMQFLLQRDEKRFSRLMFALLLDEGCNYPIGLAKSKFYALMIQRLAATLGSEEKVELTEGLPEALFNMTHVQFSEAIRFCLSHVKNPENQMATDVIESLEQIKMEWLLDPVFFTQDLVSFNHRLQEIVEQFSEGTPTGRLSTLPLGQVRRRLYIALTTSLLKYVSGLNPFQLRFGSVHEAIKAMQADHTVFCRVMEFFRTQIPYFTHLASQTFWRTLQNMNTEKS